MRKRVANYCISSQNQNEVFLQDIGPWDQYPTITNSAEEVVEEIAQVLHGRRLFYYDSEGDVTELVVRNDKFARFA